MDVSLTVEELNFIAGTLTDMDQLSITSKHFIFNLIYYYK
jgi:hypothetical protein